jgi:opacity protein-like surface antigen
MKKLLVFAFLGLTPASALAADLGGHSSYKDDLSSVVGSGATANWTGLYIGAGLGHNSTSHDVKGQQDDSSAKFLGKTDYLNSNIYSYVSETKGAACSDGKNANCVKGHYAADTIVYTNEVPAEGDTSKTLWKPAGSTVTAKDKAVIGDGLAGVAVNSAKANDKVGAGDLSDAVMANAGPAVGYTVDATSFFTQSPTGKGWAPSLMIGYDKQVSSMVFGVMADYQFRSASTDFGNGLSISQSDAFFLGGRLGFLPTQRVLVYGLAGYTWLNHNGAADALRAVDTINDAAYTEHSASYSDGSFGGLTVGAGVETVVMPNVRIGLEARETWYGKETILNSTFTDPSAHTRVSTNVTDELSELTVMGTIKLNLTGDASPFK